MSKFENAFILFNGGEFSALSNNTNTSYADISVFVGDGANLRRNGHLWLYTSANHPNATIYYEAVMWVGTAGQTVYAQLHDTSNNAVSGSEISTTSNTANTRVRSGSISLSNGTVYKPRMKVAASTDDPRFMSHRIIIDYDGTSFSSFETFVNLVTNEMDFAETGYTDATNWTDSGNVWRYDSANWDGSPAFYLEMIGSNQNAGTTYSQMRNRTDSSNVASSEITTTSTSTARIRSGSLTLTANKDYIFQFKRSAQNGQICGERVIIVQTSPSKFELRHNIKSYRQANVSNTSYTTGNDRYYFDPAVWSVSSRTTYFEGDLGSNGTITIYLQLYNVTGSAAITGSELSTTSSTVARVRSGDIDANLPGTAATLAVQYKESGGTSSDISGPGRLIFVTTIAVGTQYNETYTEVVALVDTTIKAPTRILTDAIPLVDVLNKSTSRTLTDVIPLVDTIFKAPARILSEIVTLVDTFLSTSVFGRTLNEVITLVDSVFKSTARTLSEAIPLVDVFAGIKVTAKELLESVTLVDTLVKAPGKILSEAVTLVDSIVRSITRTLTDVVSLVDLVIRSTVRSLLESVILVDALTSLKIYLREMTEQIPLVDTLVKSSTKFLSETVTLVDSVIRSASRTFSEVLTLVDTFVSETSRAIQLLESVVLVDTVTSAYAKILTLTETITLKFANWRDHVQHITGWTQDTESNTGWDKEDQNP